MSDPNQLKLHDLNLCSSPSGQLFMLTCRSGPKLTEPAFCWLCFKQDQLSSSRLTSLVLEPWPLENSPGLLLSSGYLDTGCKILTQDATTSDTRASYPSWCSLLIRPSYYLFRQANPESRYELAECPDPIVDLKLVSKHDAVPLEMDGYVLCQNTLLGGSACIRTDDVRPFRPQDRYICYRRSCTEPAAVSYTHLTLPTKRIV
eukprot:TRINITY_DN60723_c0_g1_i1.p1 TRINITY_DN60723_c0_g1~~TRINITY_DN60723_c0_g1_i1.p1  ORF type:complete len:203 (-),score=15.20 TRINITY_DN60723_c0_g1_i1:164-772(-)